MDPQLSAAAIALLFGAAKIGVIGTVGFAIAWLRGRARIRALEKSASGQVGGASTDRLDRLDQSMDYVVSQLDRIAEAQDALQRQLRAPHDRPRGVEGDTKPE
jgi:hypothetical protein